MCNKTSPGSDFPWNIFADIITFNRNKVVIQVKDNRKIQLINDTCKCFPNICWAFANFSIIYGILETSRGEKLGQKSEECYFLKRWDSHSGHWGWTPKVKQSKDKLDYKIIPELKSWATDSIFTYLIDENRNLSDCYIIKIVKNTAGCE